MSDNWRESEFRELLAAKLKYESDPTLPRVKEIAAKMGMSATWLYRVLEGSVAPNPEQLMAIISAVGNEDLYRWLEDRLPGCRILIDRNAGIRTNGQVDDDLLFLGALHGRLCDAFLSALKDGVLNTRERTLLLTLVSNIEAQCTTLREEIKRAGGGA